MHWLLPLILSGLFALMIFYTETVIAGAKSGIEICIYTLLPSLFPFILMATMLTDATSGIQIPVLKPLVRLCGIPKGAEGIFLVGILGGYPAGAQAVAESYKDGKINLQEANHLLRFCNNAGPAFIFGVIGAILGDIRLCFLIWLVHICSAIITGMLFAAPNIGQMQQKRKNFSIVVALDKTVKTMAKICGWVILFRIIITFADRYLMQYLPTDIMAILCGILELSNGCIRLAGYDAFSIFVIASFILSFGGICVWMQTASIIKPLKMYNFCIGKGLQSMISIILCFLVAPLRFNLPMYISAISGVVLFGFVFIIKKSSSILELSRV